MLTHNLRCLLTLSISLIVAVLISDLADRSILSTAVLFLIVGFISGPALGNWIALNAGSIGISRFSKFRFHRPLYGRDANQSPGLSRGWHLVSRVLVVGMPLTMAATAVVCHLSYAQDD